MNLPTELEINPTPENLDEQSATRHFLGKSLAEAEALFRENSNRYPEGLMFMGVSAFRFYIHAAISYIQSDAAIADPDIINSLAGLLEHRLEYEAEELRPVAPQLASVCRYVVEHYARFDVEPKYYGDLRPRFQSLEQRFMRQIHM